MVYTKILIMAQILPPRAASALRRADLEMIRWRGLKPDLCRSLDFSPERGYWQARYEQDVAKTREHKYNRKKNINVNKVGDFPFLQATNKQAIKKNIFISFLNFISCPVFQEFHFLPWAPANFDFRFSVLFSEKEGVFSGQQIFQSLIIN